MFVRLVFLLLLVKLVLLLLLVKCFHCYGNLNSPLAYNGKMENWPLSLSSYRYFDKSFTKKFSFNQLLPWQLKSLNAHGPLVFGASRSTKEVFKLSK